MSRTISKSLDAQIHPAEYEPTPGEALRVAKAAHQAKADEVTRWESIAATTTDPQTLIDARAHAEIASRELPALQDAADAAQLVYKDAEILQSCQGGLNHFFQAFSRVLAIISMGGVPVA
jgi:hypothetical protein